MQKSELYYYAVSFGKMWQDNPFHYAVSFGKMWQDNPFHHVLI